MPGTAELVYRTDVSIAEGRWQTLPDWAQYYVELGKAIFEVKQSLEDEGSQLQLKVALVVPSRTHCCAFTALGLVAKELENLRLAGGAWERVVDLGLAAKVWVQLGERRKRKYKGVLAGFDWDKKKVKVLKARGGTTVEVEAHKIESREDKGRRALAMDPGGYRLPSDQAFFSEFVRDLGVQEGGFASQDFYLIKGLRDLQVEFEELELGLKTVSNRGDEEVVSGTAQDLLRVRQLIGVSEGISLGGHFSTGRRSTVDVEHEKQSVVFCDGGQALLHKSSNLKSKVLVSILDRGDSNFNKAVQELNVAFGYRDRSRKMPRDIFEKLPGLPGGVEIMVFWGQV